MVSSPWQMPQFRRSQGYSAELPAVPSGQPFRLAEAEPVEPSILSVELDYQSQLGTLLVEVQTFLENGVRTRKFETGGWGVACSIPAGRTTVDVQCAAGVPVRAFATLAPGRVVTEPYAEVFSIGALLDITTNPPRYARTLSILLLQGDASITALTPPTSLTPGEPITVAAGQWLISSVGGGTVHLVWEVVA